MKKPASKIVCIAMATVVALALVILVIGLEIQVTLLRNEAVILTNKVNALSLVGKDLPVIASAKPNAGQVLHLRVISIEMDSNGNLKKLSGNLYIKPYPGCTYGGKAFRDSGGKLTVIWSCQGVTGLQEFSNLAVPVLMAPIEIESIVTQ